MGIEVRSWHRSTHRQAHHPISILQGHSKREAQTELIRLMDAVRRGDYIDPSKVTVSEFLDRWEKDWAANNVSPKTRERFSQLIAHQVQPHLGNMPIQKLRALHLNELYASLLRNGRVGGGELSAKTVGHVHRCLRRALGHAAQWGPYHAKSSSAGAPASCATS